MIYGVGTDIIEIERIKKIYDKAEKMSKIFTEGEKEYINSKGAASFESAAGIFAAKEAVSKAFGTGFGKLSLLDIEIKHYKTGKPYVKLNQEPNDKIYHLSISHSKNYATAVVVCESI